MKQLTIFDIPPNFYEVMAVVECYLRNFDKKNEFFSYHFDDPSQIIDDDTKICVTGYCKISGHADLEFLNKGRIYSIRFFKCGKCIITEHKRGTNNYAVSYKVCFESYEESKADNLMKNFLDWYRD